MFIFRLLTPPGMGEDIVRFAPGTNITSHRLVIFIIYNETPHQTLKFSSNNPRTKKYF
jgi:hypothetical protein